MEILTALILFGAVGLISARLFRATMRVTWDAPEAQNAIHRSETMLRLLRADCWGSSQTVPVEPSGVDIRLPDGPVAQWRIDDASITRTLGADVITWPRDVMNKGPCTFSVAGPTLTLRAGDARVTMSSELAIVDRGRAR